MKEVTIKIPDKDYPFFMELIKKLPFIKGVKSVEPTSKKALNDLQESMQELKQIKAGKLKGISAKDLLKEL